MCNTKYTCWLFVAVTTVLLHLTTAETTTTLKPAVTTPSNATIVPKPVEYLQETFAAANTIGLRWTAPNNSVIYGYNVYINKDAVYCHLGFYTTCHQGDPVYVMDKPTCHTSTTGIIFCNEEVYFNVSYHMQLLSYTHYNMTVVTSNKMILSIPRSIHVRTAVGVSGPVSDVLATAVDNSSIQVNWTAPSHMAGPTNYNIRVLEADHRTVNSSYSQLAVHTVEGYETTELLVEDLEPSWHYKFEIRAITSAGESTAAVSDVVMTDPATPGVVQNLRVSYATDQYLALLVSWECPLERERRGQISYYSVHYTGNVSLTVTSGSFFTEDPCKEPHKVYLPVTPDNTYTISVQANAEFTGRSSSTTFYADLKKMMYAFSPPSNHTVTFSKDATVVSVTMASVVVVLLVIIAVLRFWK